MCVCRRNNYLGSIDVRLRSLDSVTDRSYKIAKNMRFIYRAYYRLFITRLNGERGCRHRRLNILRNTVIELSRKTDAPAFRCYTALCPAQFNCILHNEISPLFNES